jgi:hypothetical protein
MDDPDPMPPDAQTNGQRPLYRLQIIDCEGLLHSCRIDPSHHSPAEHLALVRPRLPGCCLTLTIRHDDMGSEYTFATPIASEAD